MFRGKLLRRFTTDINYAVETTKTDDTKYSIYSSWVGKSIKPINVRRSWFCDDARSSSTECRRVTRNQRSQGEDRRKRISFSRVGD
ncbi:hypothetical protein V1478_007021 [Vespula squamosa]|uniref:Uncharacterized protein n=1 Tax=Vespula squamosa TaxID=30214 RepID=A0ABD2B204_VESSQ